MIASILQQLKVEFKIYLRQPFYLLFSLVMPVASFLFFGSLYSSQDYGAADFFSMYIPGFCMLVLFSTSVFNVGNQVISDKEKGIYNRILTTPISLTRFIGVILSKAFMLAFLGFVLILLVAHFSFSIPIGLDRLGFVAMYTLFILYSLSLGVGIAFLVNKLNTYSIAMMTAFFPMFMLSDASIPLMSLPEWAQKAAQFNPLYHANLILRTFWASNMREMYGANIWKSYVVLGLLLSVLYILVIYKWKKGKISLKQKSDSKGQLPLSNASEVI
ncbi:ABC transporter permease [Enterococcus ureasiticus]|uniref:Transport permease protein n=1 Tax=Enterococcus ureasiticus TaxID=903984 RepID=A0A1E5G8H9_9ENTE|nr:ABC transporter permease [Enterococcus ureasiticus]OEG09018.1 ABC transporter [Enterococcus ureasiticus]